MICSTSFLGLKTRTLPAWSLLDAITDAILDAFLNALNRMSSKITCLSMEDIHIYGMQSESDVI